MSLEGTSWGRLQALLEGCQADFEKALGGNKAASVRVRKAMKAIKDLAHEVRNVEMLDVRKKD